MKAGRPEANNGEDVTVSLDRLEVTAIKPNEKALAALRKIAERHRNRPFTDGSETQRLIREARSGAMYDNDRTE